MNVFENVTSIFPYPYYNGGLMPEKTVESCGLVAFRGNSVLLMKRNNKWDLPKGKSEENEQRRNTALRECEEETGLRQTYFEISRELFPTQHFASYEGETYLKTTYWFLAKFTGPSDHVFHPQTGEGIVECDWVSLNDVHTYLPNMKEYARYILVLTLDLLKSEQLNIRSST